MVRLHRECETPYRRLLDEGQGPQGSPGPHPSGSRATEPDAVCVCCYRDESEEVLRIVGPEPGSKTETLHENDRADRVSVMQGETKR